MVRDEREQDEKLPLRKWLMWNDRLKADDELWMAQADLGLFR